MFIKLIFVLQVTLSLLHEKINEVNTVRKSVRCNREKIRSGLEGFSWDNMVITRLLRVRRFFMLLLCIIDFHINKIYDPLTTNTLSLLLLKKLLLGSIFVICKLMGDLLDELINGN